MSKYYSAVRVHISGGPFRIKFCFEHSVVSQKRNIHPVSNHYGVGRLFTLLAYYSLLVLEQWQMWIQCWRQRGHGSRSGSYSRVQATTNGK